jgi:hypothetical protein
LLLAAASLCVADAAFGWIYPEHRDVTVLAVQGLDEARREAFDRLWQQARSRRREAPCAMVADAAQGVTPDCIDWAALPAIAGDHSCSAMVMLETVRHSDWILRGGGCRCPAQGGPGANSGDAPAEQSELAPGVIAEAQRRLADEASRAKRSNARRTADTRLQRADPEYARRADTNLAHFLLPRPDTNLDPSAYGRLALKPGAPLNAVGVYAWYHISALQKASRLANDQLAPDERSALVRAMLFRRGIRAALPGRRLCGRPHRGQLG